MKTVIELAEAEIGYKAAGSMSKYFSELFPEKRAMPWCVPFIEWVFQKAYGKENSLRMLCLQSGGFIWSTASLVRFFKYRNRWHKKAAKVGWLIFLRTNNEWTNHVELIIDVTETAIISIGGNCGGKVRKNIYQRDDIRIAGYGEIIYETEESECTE